MTPIRIGTRGSKLALWQANHVADRIRPLTAPRPVELVLIATAGDQVRNVPLAQIGGEGVFTKEIQRALLDGTVDVAVHSLKDLPTVPVAGLVLAAVPERGPSGDVLVSEIHRHFDELPPGAVVATSSLRRRAQALHRRPDLKLVDVRGNVETRLRKLHDQGLDALILAEAGLRRLGLGAAIAEVLDPAWMLPAVGQGALGLECRADDRQALAAVEQLNHLPTRRAVLAERAMLSALGGGCQVPMGAVCRVADDVLTLRGAVVRPDGGRRVEAEQSGPADNPEVLGQRVAAELLSCGAGDLLSEPAA
jgi:hydroxymethylbilane synthase